MSLKAKLEAVIYAAEEPVTLAQLTALFAEEALECKAKQEAAAAEQAAAGAAPGGDDAEGALESGTFLYVEFEPGPASEAISEAAEAGEEPVAEAAPEAEKPSEQNAGESAEMQGESGAPVEADAEIEARRDAKAREREARGIIRPMLDELIAEYAADGRGIEIREIAGGFRMATKPECHDAVRLFVKSQKPPLKLSLPALETLAVIAYKQPVTVPEVNEIRGVDSSGVFGSLLARKLISTAGRKPVIGRPILYKTTREFLMRFGLKDVSELPSMEEFEKMAAKELEEPEMAAGEEGAVPAEEEFNADMSVETEDAGEASAPASEPAQGSAE